MTELEEVASRALSRVYLKKIKDNFYKVLLLKRGLEKKIQYRRSKIIFFLDLRAVYSVYFSI